jgi:hypothetical protein
MQVHAARLPLCAAGLAVLVGVAVTGCAASSRSSAGAGGSSTTAQASALAAVKLTAKATDGANSFTGTMGMKATVNPGVAQSDGISGDMSMTATFAEQLHPTLLVSAQIGSYNMFGQSLPGGLTELITPTAMYLKSPSITQALHLTKPWAVISLATAGKSTGINISQLVNQATGSGPLTQAEMLGASSSVREVGTGSIGGVPVTEYTGTIPVVKAIDGLSGSAKAQMEQMNTVAGFTNETYTIWIDGQHVMRKGVFALTGATMTENVTATITSVDQPVNIAVPPTSQTSPLPASDLG